MGGKTSSKPAISFFNIAKFPNSTDNYIDIPYCFFTAVFRKFPNMDKKWPLRDIKFTTTLRDYQIPIYRSAYEQLTKFGTTTIIAPPGTGKTS